ncbi:substrate-binding domain-containing protein [Streptomyces sp. NPDC059894]|uniref:substrate-binding domain-containing protein n=1 Tax=unclassified Streptomyces TaxID=2593676 RepID=UPI0036636D5F
MSVMSRVKVGAAFGAAALGLGILAAPASADPGSTTEYRQLAGVGSDTTQYVLNGLGDVVTNANGKIIASYNATGSTTITTKDPATSPNCTINRPNGSSAGITALNNDLTAGTNCVDFARSSRGPADTSTADLTFIPYAKDGVTYATDLGSTVPTNLTKAQLASIYTNCTYTDASGATVTVQPLLPQTGSGTRTFWLSAIGITEAQVGSCVTQGIQEHDGTAIANGSQLMPYSIAQWIAQGKGFSDVPNRRGESRLRSVNGLAPTTGSGTALALNTGFATDFLRDVYNVVPTTKLGNSVIAETFVGSASKVCAATSTITNYGFGTVSNCGATTLTGER